jgi:uncharacterized protein (DUF58 family)
LIVREVQSNAVPRVQIVLDAHPLAHAGSGLDSSREWAIRVAASLAEGWIGQGAEVELVLDGASVPLRGRSAKTRSAALLDALARLAPDAKRDLAGLLNPPEYRRFNVALRVVVTTDVGLGRLSRCELQRAGDRFVVLKARGFGMDAGDAPTDSLPFVPWIEIDGAERVATCLRGIVKEVTFGR